MKKAHWLHIAAVFLSTMGFLALTGCGGGGSNSPTPTSGIGVTASGVLGQGLVLQNNGTDDLKITENRFYRFSSSFEEGSSYNITILPESSSPDQSCEVINGSGIIGPDNIEDVQIKCVTTFQESCDNEHLNPAYWSTIGEFNRSLVAGSLEYSLSSSSDFANNYIQFLDKTCGTKSADITITDTSETVTGDKMYGTRLNSCGFHTNTAGEAEGDKTGDVNAAILLRNSEAFFHVYKCLNDDCDTPETAEDLSLVSLGDVPINSTAKLLIDWNTIVPNQFTFQLNGNEQKHFDPVAQDVTIDATAPNVIDNYLGIQVSNSDPIDRAYMTATFDNISVNNSPYDNFDSGTYLNGSLWLQTYGRRQIEIETGRLLLETGQEFVNDSDADNRYHDTSYTSINGLIPNATIVQADISLDSSTNLVDLGGNPVECDAILEMEFRPPALDKKDATNTFVIQAILSERPLGLLSARLSATGCKDSQCGTKHDIPNANQTFATAITKDTTYHFTIEHMEDGIIGITLSTEDGIELEFLTLDMSTILDFTSTEFSKIGLKTQTRGTDQAGEKAIVRAYFDNIQMGM